PGRAAEQRAAHLDPVAVGGGLGDDEPLLERLAAGAGGVVEVGDVVGDRVEPGAGNGRTGTRDPDGVESRHVDQPLITSCSWLYLLSRARSASWYESPVVTFDRVSSSRFTLLPLSCVGSSEVEMLGCTWSTPVPPAS